MNAMQWDQGCTVSFQEPVFTEEFQRANDLSGGIELLRDTPDDQDLLKKLNGSKIWDMVDVLKSGWTLLMTNLILEIASAVFDQLGYALVGMVLAFVALLLATAELIPMDWLVLSGSVFIRQWSMHVLVRREITQLRCVSYLSFSCYV
ncbi:hypothetical protein SADUNF_Sadunf19G0007100 [Salix dunnii]|uniref:Uncharacterized protein n=1 Tax=Salix dunnii TaxID=1413687 RepID=A0A835J0Q5_9ROSI|nr:hypothetical protein SADUNF_Sadunf19G0007100 [Salix dunnii]